MKTKPGNLPKGGQEHVHPHPRDKRPLLIIKYVDVMKKNVFLLAATVLLAACSSDELSNVVNNGEVTPPAEKYATADMVSFTNGTAISIGDVDVNGEPMTRAEGEDEVHFNLPISNGILKEFEEYVLKADDFAIRVNGEYVEGIQPEEGKNVITMDGIIVSEHDADATMANGSKGFKVCVRNLQKLDFKKADDYTFEVYMWIENKKLLDDGTGSYGELFTDENKFIWIDEWGKSSEFDQVPEGEKYAALLEKYEDIETGNDVSRDVFYTWAGLDYKYFNTKEGGFLVRYNVYRGLSGQNGDTPYIKVSIHVEKQEQTTTGTKYNDCTFVDLSKGNEALNK